MVFYELKELLKQYDDQRMKPLHELTVQKLKLQLALRNLSDTNASQQELIERLKIHENPSMDKMLIYRFILEE